jgi:hypothetical protein
MNYRSHIYSNTNTHHIDQNIFRQTTNRTHQTTSCSPTAKANLLMRITETFYTHLFKIINRVDWERHASAHHKQTQTAFARTTVIPICASLRTSTSVERLAFFSTQNTVSLLHKNKTKQHTYIINLRKIMSIRNRTRSVAVSPGWTTTTAGLRKNSEHPASVTVCCNNTSPLHYAEHLACAQR